MKFLKILDGFIFLCCIFSTYCFDMEELSSGLLKNRQKFLKNYKTDRFESKSDLHNYVSVKGKTLKNKEYSNPTIEDKTVSKWDLSSRAGKDKNTPDELQKDILYVKEQMATTSMPVTDFPHGFIVPGTKWCGRGNIAEREDDFGLEVEADKCCRNHDRCPDHLIPGETKHNLTNYSSFTSSSCECDNTFYECLQQANTILSNSIGIIYFTFTAKDCYALDYPRTCKKYMPLLKFCIEYEVDTSAEKIYQWIPAKKYMHL